MLRMWCVLFKAQLEATEATSQEVTEALSSLMVSSAGAASSTSHKGSPADTSDSDGESQSVVSDDELTTFDSDSMMRVKVAMAGAAAGMIFDFGMSNVGKVRIHVMEHVSYFMKGHARPPGLETVPTPWADEPVGFEDLFSTGLRMPPHSELTDNLQKFHVQLHQLTPNVILQIDKFIWMVTSCGATVKVFTKYYELRYP
jgi:hypothetical protein